MSRKTVFIYELSPKYFQHNIIFTEFEFPELLDLLTYIIFRTCLKFITAPSSRLDLTIHKPD